MGHGFSCDGSGERSRSCFSTYTIFRGIISSVSSYPQHLSTIPLTSPLIARFSEANRFSRSDWTVFHRTRQEVLPEIVTKCFGATRGGTKTKGIEVALMYVEVENGGEGVVVSVLDISPARNLWDKGSRARGSDDTIRLCSSCKWILACFGTDGRVERTGCKGAESGGGCRAMFERRCCVSRTPSALE